MATKIRPRISRKNRWWISKHRHYELKHYCLQYPEWKQIYKDTDGYGRVASEADDGYSDRTAECGMLRAKYIDKIQMIERIARETDEELAGYILQAVTEDLSFTYLKTTLDIPCGRDLYYDRYRRFFWLLDQVRD